jgi:hypothetical protein
VGVETLNKPHVIIQKKGEEEILVKYSLLRNDALVLEAKCTLRSQFDSTSFHTELPGGKLHLVIFPWRRRVKQVQSQY